MLRKDFVDKYNDEMVEAFSELFNTARKKMFHPGDLLLCQQNGTMFGKDTVIGSGNGGFSAVEPPSTVKTKEIKMGRGLYTLIYTGIPAYLMDFGFGGFVGPCGEAQGLVAISTGEPLSTNIIFIKWQNFNFSL